jgi:hypothetical protein
MVFKWHGKGMSGDPNAVGHALHDLIDNGKSLTPEVVVEAAEPEESILHRYFNWDDSTAAHKYRCDQARQLVAAVVLVEEEETPKTFPPVRAFASVVENEVRSYVPVQRVVLEADLNRQLLSDIRRAIQQFTLKLQSLNAFGEVTNRLVSVQEQLDIEIGNLIK